MGVSSLAAAVATDPGVAVARPSIFLHEPAAVGPCVVIAEAPEIGVPGIRTGTGWPCAAQLDFDAVAAGRTGPCQSPARRASPSGSRATECAAGQQERVAAIACLVPNRTVSIAGFARWSVHGAVRRPPPLSPPHAAAAGKNSSVQIARAPSAFGRSSALPLAA